MFQYSLAERTVPVPVSVPGKRFRRFRFRVRFLGKRFRRFRFPVPVRFLVGFFGGFSGRFFGGFSGGFFDRFLVNSAADFSADFSVGFRRRKTVATAGRSYGGPSEKLAGGFGIFRSCPLTSQKLPLCGNDQTQRILGQLLRSLLQTPPKFSEVAPGPEVRPAVHTAPLCLRFASNHRRILLKTFPNPIKQRT